MSGFDIVIGNPPYGAKLNKEQKSVLKSLYRVAISKKDVQKGNLDTYALFIELALNLLKKQGIASMIVPLSFTSSDSSSALHNLLKEYCDSIYVSSYAVRPQPVFANAFVNTSIFKILKTNTKCKRIFSTKLYRKGKDFNLSTLLENLEYIDVTKYLMFGRIPKISNQIEIDILNKLSKFNDVKSLLKEKGSPIFYRFAGGRYFKVVTNYTNNVSSERIIYFENSKIANAVGCILSSSLAFWFYQIYSDNLNWKAYEIESMKIPNFDATVINTLNTLYEMYLKDIENKVNIRKTSEQSSYSVDSFKEYKIGRSKEIIDKIDDYLGKIFGFSSCEVNFIKNYEINFRLSENE